MDISVDLAIRRVYETERARELYPHITPITGF
jgi:hypothetical protein